MILLKSVLFHRHQGGFTALEMIVSLLISSIIALGAAMANTQVLTQTARNNDYTTASRSTLNAIQWIGTDAQMAQTITPGVNAGFPLTLAWIEWDSTSNTVVYTLEDGKLKRSYTVDGGAPRQTLIAEYINPDEDLTYCTTDNGTLTLMITASVGQGAKVVDVTKIREITSRPNL
ncbi:MAG TPA: prepilin-type N-terminal cleavage/methylation domain-containing protein [Dehalococcoidales bacterium]|nr:MAG: hypothetical protein A2Z05_00745 [Chloroflexi bacterium RBG_16_60_22]HJX13311.1 prepilin-type N-terminal cleavage/methylation domain-containing protein [Dehalococcoidales bacterium]